VLWGRRNVVYGEVEAGAVRVGNVVYVLDLFILIV
jgi:hypothetical protein